MRGAGESPRAVRLAMAALGCLILLLPAGFRARYGAELRSTLRERLREAWEVRGWPGVAGCWIAEAGDLLATALRLRHGGRWGGAVPALGGAAAAVALAWWVLEAPPRTAPGVEVYEELVVRASDDAGEFTLTLRSGRLVAATLGGSPVPPGRLRQAGREIRILDEVGRVVLLVEMELPGTIRWEPRLASAS